MSRKPDKLRPKPIPLPGVRNEADHRFALFAEWDGQADKDACSDLGEQAAPPAHPLNATVTPRWRK